MKKKLACLILILLAVNLSALDKDNYKAISMDEIIKIAEKSDMGDSGASMFIEHYNLEVSLNAYPVTIDKYSKAALEFYAKSTSLYATYGQDFIDMHKYETTLKYKDYKITLLWQEKLIKNLETEKKLNENFIIYFTFGCVDHKNKEIYFLVSEL